MDDLNAYTQLVGGQDGKHKRQFFFFRTGNLNSGLPYRNNFASPCPYPIQNTPTLKVKIINQ